MLRHTLLPLILIFSAGSLSETEALAANYRSPIDFVLSQDGKWLLTVNQTSNSVSLIEIANEEVADELALGSYLTSLALSPNDNRVFVVSQQSHELIPVRFREGALYAEAAIKIGLEPYGVAISVDGRTGYVTQAAGSSVAVVNLVRGFVTKTIPVGPWPRTLCLTPDGSRLAVACNGDRTVSVIDPKTEEVLYDEPFGGINAGQMIASRDSTQVYFPWMVYRHNPITQENIRRGWVLGSRIGRVQVTKSTTREAITLDPRGQAVADPHGMALTSDEKWLIASAGGTQELLVYKMEALYFESVGGPGDHISPSLLNNRERFTRIPLGGRPLNIRLASDDRTVYVANYLLDAIQVVDLEERRVARTISLSEETGEPSAERLGEAIFYNGKRSLDQWYSCHSCHWEGETNAVTMDTTNDGSNDTFKTVLSLKNVTYTAPWTWHGWQNDFQAAMRKSLTETMRGPPPSSRDVEMLASYLRTLQPAKSPYLNEDGSLSEAAERGRKVFQSAKAGCSQCHNGPYLTDGEIHDVGLGSEKDRYEGFNTPSLLGVHRKVRLLHNGRARSLHHLLTKYHKPEDLGNGRGVNDDELSDLIEYLRSL